MKGRQTLAQRRALRRLARAERAAAELERRVQVAPKGRKLLALVRLFEARTRALRATP